MSSLFALFCVPSVKKHKHEVFLFLSMYNKTIITFGFCDIQNNQGLGKGYQPQPSASADNPYLDLDYSGYHKNLIQYLFQICYLTYILAYKKCICFLGKKKKKLVRNTSRLI